MSIFKQFFGNWGTLLVKLPSYECHWNWLKIRQYRSKLRPLPVPMLTQISVSDHHMTSLLGHKELLVILYMCWIIWKWLKSSCILYRSLTKIQCMWKLIDWFIDWLIYWLIENTPSPRMTDWLIQRFRNRQVLRHIPVKTQKGLISY